MVHKTRMLLEYRGYTHVFLVTILSLFQFAFCHYGVNLSIVLVGWDYQYDIIFGGGGRVGGWVGGGGGGALKLKIYRHPNIFKYLDAPLWTHVDFIRCPMPRLFIILHSSAKGYVLSLF